MQVVIKKRALNTLEKVADWIASQYFLDTGVKWLDEFASMAQELADAEVKHALCRHESLSRWQYRCFTYKNKWVVAYKISRTKFTIYRFVLGSRLR